MNLHEDIKEAHKRLAEKIESGYEKDQCLISATEPWLKIFYPEPGDLDRSRSQCVEFIKQGRTSSFWIEIERPDKRIKSILDKVIENGFKVKSRNSKERTIIVQAWSYLMLGLIVVVLATIIFCDYDKIRSSKSREVFNAAVTPGSSSKNGASSLFIIIDAERKDFILGLSKACKSGESVNLGTLPNELYECSTAIWMGDSQSPEAQRIREVSQKSRSSAIDSEYDVHIVEASLMEFDAGFERSANPVDRRDAFKRLSSNCRKITQVSSRLSSSSYEGLGFYS